MVSPRLDTIKMVEKTFIQSDKYPLTLAEVKALLPKKVNHNTLKTIIRYLDEINHVIISVDGITYIHNPSRKLKKAIENGYELTPEGLRKFKGKAY
ncbi:MAG: hypothetical protein ACP5NW_01525 [Candidatus Woesearchaeota archaeon]